MLLTVPRLILVLTGLLLAYLYLSVPGAGPPTGGGPPREMVMARVQGSILTDEGVPPASVRVSCAFHGEAEVAVGALILDSGQFALEYPWDGTCSLTASLDGQVLTTLSDIEVESGRTTDVILDLRGLLYSFHFSLEGPDGGPLEGGVFCWRASSPEDTAPRYESCVAVRGGEVRFQASSPVLDVLILPDGAAVTELRGISHGRVLTLDEGWWAEVRLPEAVDPYADGTTFEVLVFEQEDDPRISRGSSLAGEQYDRLSSITLDGGRCRLELPHRGPWAIEWRAYLDGERLEIGRSRTPFQLARGDGSEVLEPVFPLSEYRAALARARR